MNVAAAVVRLQRALVLTRWTAAGLLLAAVATGANAQGSDPLLAARTKGSKTAPVTVYEMADFQCPVCRTFAKESFPALQAEFINTGKVKWIFVNFPLTQIHPNAVAAADFAACAAIQNKFWPAHDLLYSTQERWEKLKDPAPFFLSQIGGLGLNQDRMTTCLQSGTGAAIVRDDAAGAERTGARSTPSFYIEGGLVEGMYPLDVMRKVLDSVYKAKTKK
jgi:protein-disulfide isomerase